jgi:hypothetical protein
VSQPQRTGGDFDCAVDGGFAIAPVLSYRSRMRIATTKRVIKIIRLSGPGDLHALAA